MMGMDAVQDPKPRVKHKTFTYKTALRWLSGRSGVISSEGKHDLRASAPPEFKGEAGLWTPEDFFVAAIDLCTMTTFASFAQHLQIQVLAYRSEAEGTLEFVDGGYRFTRVVLRPVIVVASRDAVAAAEKAIHEAHESCIIGHSVRTHVAVEPRVEVADGV